MPYFSLRDASLTVTLDNGETFTVLKENPDYDRACRMVLEKKWDGIKDLLSPAAKIAHWAAMAGFKMKDNHIQYQGYPIPADLNKRIVAMMGQGTCIDPMFRFIQRLSRNPSYRSVQQLFTFLQHCGIPITKRGTFLAYKGVKADYTDCHTGKISNRPGAEVTYPRNRVSDDPRTPCHEGLHVGDLSYAQGFAQGRVVICEVDPENVVCVPYDASHRKMRLCAYKVVGNYGDKLDDLFQPSEEIPEIESLSTPAGPGEPEEEGFDPELGDDDYDDGYLLDSDEDEDELDEPLASLEAALGDSTPAPTVEQVGAATVTHPLPAPPEEEEPVWAYLREIRDRDVLLTKNLQHLRKYARHDLTIVGASKIRGGKIALVDRILATLE